MMEQLNIQSTTAIEKLVKLTEKIEKLTFALEKNNELLVSNTQSKNNPDRRDSVFLSVAEIIIQILKKHPEGLIVAQIAEKTGYSDTRVRDELFKMEESDMVRRKRTGIKRTFAYVLRQDN